MKRTALIITLFLIVKLSYSQDIPKPEFNDVPYFWNKETNELIMLTKETADMKGGMKMSYKYPGSESKTKLSTSKISLIIDSSNPAILTAMKIYKLEVKKKSREVAVVSAGFGGANMRDENVIDFNSKNLEGNIYELVLSSKLDKGEYTLTNGMVSYTFSIN